MSLLELQYEKSRGIQSSLIFQRSFNACFILHDDPVSLTLTAEGSYKIIYIIIIISAFCMIYYI